MRLARNAGQARPLRVAPTSRPWIAGLALIALAVGSWTDPAWGESKTYQVTVDAGKHDRTNTPVCVLLEESNVQAKSVVLVDAEGRTIPAQLTDAGLSRQPKAAGACEVCELHFLLPSLKRGETVKLKATVSSQPPPAGGFCWKDTPGASTELGDGGRPVMRYMYQSREAAQQAGDTFFKPYHHLFDPAGTRLVTKGDRDGLYPHHRGLFYGFSRISYAGVDRANTWGCDKDQYQSHQGFLAQEAGPVLGRHQVAIDWHGKESKVFAQEKRELTAYRRPGGTLVEFASRLTSTVGPVKLDGDPQHAGFQFRAAEEVVQRQKETCYLRPDGRGQPGETRNWDAKGRDPRMVNLPWDAMSFLVGGVRYTAVYLDHPANPKEARSSERPYGRFGSYFEYQLDQGKDLEIRYRLWLQEGEMTVAEAAALSADFVEPVGAKGEGRRTKDEG